MAIDFTKITEWQIPEGKVSEVRDSAGRTIWTGNLKDVYLMQDSYHTDDYPYGTYKFATSASYTSEQLDYINQSSGSATSASYPFANLYRKGYRWLNFVCSANYVGYAKLGTGDNGTDAVIPKINTTVNNVTGHYGILTIPMPTSDEPIWASTSGSGSAPRRIWLKDIFVSQRIPGLSNGKLYLIKDGADVLGYGYQTPTFGSAYTGSAGTFLGFNDTTYSQMPAAVAYRTGTNYTKFAFNSAYLMPMCLNLNNFKSIHLVYANNKYKVGDTDTNYGYMSDGCYKLYRPIYYQDGSTIAAIPIPNTWEKGDAFTSAQDGTVYQTDGEKTYELEFDLTDVTNGADLYSMIGSSVQAVKTSGSESRTITNVVTDLWLEAKDGIK